MLRPMLRHALAMLTLMLPMAAFSQPMAADAIRPGVDYEIITPAQPGFAPKAGKIEVVEVFSYACPHCAHFHTSVEPWKKKLPADVNFIYMHSIGQPAWERFTRGFYAAESKKLTSRTHEALFKAIFTEQRVSPNASMDEIAQFYSAFGVSQKAFLDLMASPTIAAAANKSKEFTIRTGVMSTPTLVINGKYRLNANERGFTGLLRTADMLIAKERTAMATNKKAAASKK